MKNLVLFFALNLTLFNAPSTKANEITAEAILEVQLDEPSGRKPIYTGRFLGHARLTSPFLSQDDEVDVLRESMQQAIEQITMTKQQIKQQAMAPPAPPS